MELFVVTFGDSYERWVAGVAESLEGARSVARAYLAADPSEADNGFFQVERRALGSAAYVLPEELALDD